jgi:hypothetical protein
MPPNSGRIVIVLPGSMPFRLMVGSGVLEKLRDRTEKSIMVICPDERYHAELPDSIEWRELYNPSNISSQTLIRRMVRYFTLRIESLLNISYAGLAYRFNEISKFRTHQYKKSMSKERKLREELAGNFVNSRYGIPFASSGYLYRIYYAIFFRKWFIPDGFIEHFFQEEPIDLIVFWHAQNSVYRDYVQCARVRSIPMVAAIGSWDRATTKGPLMPGLVKAVAINQVMKSELIKYHGVVQDLIEVVGWPQMDNYMDRLGKDKQQTIKNVFLRKYGFKSDATLVVYAASTERLGAHEPEIAIHLAKFIREGGNEKRICLFLRPHPQDLRFKDRFSEQLKNEIINYEDASLTNLGQLAELFSAADVVISTQGSISLDAVAFDCRVINIAFNGNGEPPYHQSVERYYEMDHYQPVVDSGGVAIVKSYVELDDALMAYISDYNLHCQGRVQLRERMLEPFDGKSADRIVDVLLNELRVVG